MGRATGLMCLLWGCSVFDPSLVERDAAVDSNVPDVSEDVRDAGVDTTDVSVDVPVDVPDAGADITDVSIDTNPCPLNTRGLWVWESQVLFNPSTRRLELDDIAEAGFGRIFIDSERFLPDSPTVLEAIVRDAKERCLEVDLLFGAAEWSRTSEHDYVRELVRQAVAAFDESDVAPRAIHLDIEPYTLPEWTDDQDGIAEQWVTLIESIAAQIELPLVLDVPFWWHEPMLTRDDTTQSMLGWAFESADEIGVLAYRDTVNGDNGIITLASASLAAAESTSRKVFVGIETNCVEPTSITFCEEGRAAADMAVADVQDVLRLYDSFEGMAVHSWAAYEALDP